MEALKELLVQRLGPEALNGIHWAVLGFLLSALAVLVRAFSQNQKASLAVSPSFGLGDGGLSGRRYITKREDTIAAIWTLLNRNGVMLIIAPSQSGKTSMLRLMDTYLNARRLNAVYVNCAQWPVDFDLNEMMRETCGHTLQELLDGALGDQPCVILMDGAQLIYYTHGGRDRHHAAEFWRQLRRLAYGAEHAKHRVRVVLAASYGTRPSSQESNSRVSIPIRIEHPDRLVTVSPAEPGYVSLALTDSEASELQRAFLELGHLQLPETAFSIIFRLCGYQVGLITACLDFLERQLADLDRRPELILARAVAELLSMNFMRYLSAAVRSFVYYDQLQKIPGALDVLRQLLWAGQLDRESVGLEAAVNQLIRLGQVDVSHHDRLSFTSPLHRAWFMSECYSSPCLEPEATDMLAVMVATIERLDPEVLQCIQSLDNKGRRLPGRCWQMEVHRAAMTWLPAGTVMSPGVGQWTGHSTEHIYVDLFLPEPYSLVLELTWDGKDFKEQHIDRFLDPDKYQPLLDGGLVEHHAVVDFRTPGSKQPQPCKQDDHMYTVTFNESYTAAQLWHRGSCIRQLTVAGNADRATKQALQAAMRAAMFAPAPGLPST